jgi:hypothetical protein
MVSEALPSETQRDLWLLSCDDDGHWYVIPAAMEQEFTRFVEKIANGGDPEVPTWAHAVGGSPSLVHFPDGWSIK